MMFARSGANGASVGLITIVKAFYHGRIRPVAALLLTMTTEVRLKET